MCDVLSDKTLYEVVAVVISRMRSQFERLSNPLAGGDECVQIELTGKIYVGQPLIDQNPIGKHWATLQNQFGCVISAPCHSIGTEIASKGSFPPGRLRRIHDGRKCRYRFERCGWRNARTSAP